MVVIIKNNLTCKGLLGCMGACKHAALTLASEETPQFDWWGYLEETEI